MLKIPNVKMKLGDTEYTKKISQLLHLPKHKIKNVELVKQAIDARRKGNISFVCAFTFEVENEEQILKKNPKLQLTKVKPYHYPKLQPTKQKIVVIGSGPAGLFCAYQLARSGQSVTIIERGSAVEQRSQEVAEFFQGKELQVDSNIQFGEGGAGTFSDGKLTTGVKDIRKQFVLETFVKHGATKDILYLNKPHIGTDYLVEVVKNMREYIISHGGEFLFNTKLVDIVIKDQQVHSILVEHQKQVVSKPVDQLVVAIGHSARDTYQMLYDKGIEMVQKSFAVGFRIEHLQSFINLQQYGKFANHPSLKAADYKLAVQTSGKRGVYTFCMCPGGKVVNASSEKEHLVVNGMSNYARDERNANSAILVTVDSKDFTSETPLAGIDFQRQLESKAYALGGSDGSIPIQYVEDYLGTSVPKVPAVEPSVLPRTNYANLASLFSQEINDALKEGLEKMNHKIPGFTKNAVLSGVESRSSAPVRIVRNDTYQSSVLNLYPIGEGAGYAGGIMSSAMDGLRCAEMLLKGAI